MKKLICLGITAIFAGQFTMAQPVSDQAVIPVAVTLNQVLRINVTNGGNVEFVFNTIAQYENGLSSVTSFYTTDFTVASSTDWELYLGAEDASLLGTDNPADNIALNNVGYRIAETGSYTFGTGVLDQLNTPVANGPFGNPGIVNGLAQYTGAGPVVITQGAAGNAGDVTENAFTIFWECGTTVTGGATPMNTVSLLTQSPAPDRYVTNVLLDLNRF